MLMCSALQNGTGFLSRCELAQMLRENGVSLSPDQLNIMFAKLDAVRICYVYTFNARVKNHSDVFKMSNINYFFNTILIKVISCFIGCNYDETCVRVDC